MKQELREAVVVAFGRSAVGKAKKGSLKNTHPVDIGGQVLRGVLDKVPQLDPKEIGDVIIGCAKHEAVQGFNMARIISLRAGLPYDVPAQTINRFCSSGLQSIHTAANLIRTGDVDVAIGGGVEVMSPFDIGAKESQKCPWMLEHEPNIYMSNGETAENVADMYHVTRREMDELAVDSHIKAAKAIKEGRFTKQIIPIMALNDEGQWVEFKDDEGVRADSSLETLAKLKPFIKADGSVTAGNSSQMNDAGAMVMLMSREKADSLGLKPIARYIGASVSGLDPKIMGLGPINAVRMVMKKTGLSVSDMDVIELNEAFAAQALPCIKETGMDYSKVNVNGGAIALGHPLGATGAILTIKALSELERINGRYALVTMCIGGGMGMACIFERI